MSDTDSPSDVQTSLLAAESNGPNDNDLDPEADTTIDESCHNCGTSLTSNTGVLMDGWRVRTGVCPDCRLDGVGSAAFVQLDPDSVTDRVQKRLQKDQSGNAQSVYTAAAFMDWNAPAGEYDIRRVEATRLRVALPDDVDADRQDLFAAHLRDVAGDTWFVQSLPDQGVIYLVDRTMGQDPNGPPSTGP